VQPAYAGGGDIQREIKAQQATANDLSALDNQKLVADEIALLKTWLDEAWNRQSKDQSGKAREVLERCVAQTDLIRQKLTSAKAKADADAHERAARDARDKVQKTKKALDDANVKKKAMEMNAK
jgi:hypothetical protein